MWQIIAYKLDAGYCGTDSYGFMSVDTLEDIEISLHERAMDWESSYGFGDEEAQELMEEGMSEEEAWDIANSNAEERVGYEYVIVGGTYETKQDADDAIKLLGCPSEFIVSPY